MAQPDKVFEQTYNWYRASVSRALAASPNPAVERLIWQMLGVLNPAAPPPVPDLTDFKDTGADAQSLAVASQIVAEALVALDTLTQAVDGLRPGGNPAAALAVVAPVMQQIERLHQMQAGSRYPSAFSLGKMLLTLSGDARANPAAGRRSGEARHAPGRRRRGADGERSDGSRPDQHAHRQRDRSRVCAAEQRAECGLDPAGAPEPGRASRRSF